MPPRSSPVSLPHGPARVYTSPEAIRARAIQHAEERLEFACETISLLGSLALQWTRPYTPTITIAAAAVQDAKAHGGEQAAHILPGQIYVAGMKPWELAKGHRLHVKLLARFEVTAAVPAAMNVADSAAESAGLREAFRKACEQSWQRAIAGVRDLTPTFEDFLKDANRAFLAAMLAKHDKSNEAALKLDFAAGINRWGDAITLRLYRAHGVTAKEMGRQYPIKVFRG